MGKYEWEVSRAVVEEEIVFPNERAYRSYLRSLDIRDEPYTVVSENVAPDRPGYVVVMRKRYGEYAFLGERDLPSINQEQMEFWRQFWNWREDHGPC